MLCGCPSQLPESFLVQDIEAKQVERGHIDNAHPHTAKLTKSFIEAKNITLVPHTPLQPKKSHPCRSLVVL